MPITSSKRKQNPTRAFVSSPYPILSGRCIQGYCFTQLRRRNVTGTWGGGLKIILKDIIPYPSSHSYTNSHGPVPIPTKTTLHSPVNHFMSVQKQMRSHLHLRLAWTGKEAEHPLLRLSGVYRWHIWSIDFNIDFATPLCSRHGYICSC